MIDEKLVRFNSFRKLCLSNSQDALRAAELLKSQNLNHIVFHLALLSLEEVGKIFVGWYQITTEKKLNQDGPNISIDDHIKKIFWAIWGPTFTNEKITKQQMDEIRGMSKKLHSRRLESLYTDLMDSNISSTKIDDEEAESLLRFAKSCLEIAEAEGEVNEEMRVNEDMSWFIRATDRSKRVFIFGDESQEKLVEFGDVTKWIKWLREHFEKEEMSLKEILLDELRKEKPLDIKLIKPKWKMKYKIISQSHSIRPNIFKTFNEKYGFVSLSKGGDNHTLIVEATFGTNILPKELWEHGIVFGKLFVAALNVASNGLFYWNIIVDIDKYYDTIWDIENNKYLSARLENGLRIKWEDGRMVLREEHLHLTIVVYEYFCSVYDKKDFSPIMDYVDALGMMAKTDIHLRLEKESFELFYNCFVSAVQNNQAQDGDKSIIDIGYEQIEKMLKGRIEFDRIMNLGKQLQQTEDSLHELITLGEVIAAKQYAGIYLLTLAARKQQKDNTLCLLPLESDEEQNSRQ